MSGIGDYISVGIYAGIYKRIDDTPFEFVNSFIVFCDYLYTVSPVVV